MQSSRTKGIARTIFVCAALTSFFVNDARAQTPDRVNPAAPTSWTNLDAEHVYGFPDIKAGRKGKLVLTADSFTFTDKSSNSSVARSSILALSNGTEQVEMWGTTGQMVRMVLPDGGVLAGAVLHHRVGMLTVDFVDNRGGMHSAVFDMAPAQSDAAMTMFATIPIPSRAPLEAVSCADAQTNPGSVLVAEPN